MQADWSVRNQFRAGSARPSSPFRFSVTSFLGGEEGLVARLQITAPTEHDKHARTIINRFLLTTVHHHYQLLVSNTPKCISEPQC